MHVVAFNLNTDTAKPLFTGKAKSHSKWRGKLNPVFGEKSEHPEKKGNKKSQLTEAWMYVTTHNLTQYQYFLMTW